MLRLIKKCVLLTTILFTVSAHGQTAREIVSHYLDTVSNGNVENWNKIKSTYTESEGYYSQGDYEGKLNLLSPDKSSFSKHYAVWPQHRTDIYSDSTFQNLTSSFYFLKDRGIIIFGQGPPIIKPGVTRSEYNTEFLPSKIGKLLNNSKSVELVGRKSFPMDGIVCYEIKITVKEQTFVLYINVATFLLEYWNARPDQDLSILTKYYNYKKVDGFLIPFSDSLARNGIVYYWNKIRRIELNANIDPNLFEYPSKK